MPQLHDLSDFCDTFLDVNTVPDPYCVNGTQVPRIDDTPVAKVALAVTPSINIINQAVTWGADVLLCHHGFFWGKGVRELDITLARRLHTLMNHNIALLTYHLPLDAHPKIGNNAQLMQQVGISNYQMIDIAAVGSYLKPISRDDITQKITDAVGQSPNFIGESGSNQIQKIGICSGGGGSLMSILQAHNIDTFITGEISEQHWHLASELGINLIAAGHYHTEKCGIQALGTEMTKVLPGLQTKFFAEDCPV